MEKLLNAIAGRFAKSMRTEMADVNDKVNVVPLGMEGMDNNVRDLTKDMKVVQASHSKLASRVDILEKQVEEKFLQRFEVMSNSSRSTTFLQ